jgi:hypothetical protein
MQNNIDFRIGAFSIKSTVGREGQVVLTLWKRIGMLYTHIQVMKIR